MLDVIRQNAGSWLIKFILGAIVVVFVFWGVGSFRSQRLDIVAKVNGEKILVEAYQQAYSNTLERYRQMFGGQIPEGFLQQMNLKEQVLAALVDDALVRQAAEDLGVIVSDEEVRGQILAFPNFKRNGAFDQIAYERALRQARLTPVAFEAQVRQQLLTEKVKALVTAGLSVPTSEAKERYLFENEEIAVTYAAFDAAAFQPEVAVTDEELAEWYETAKNGYMTDPQVSLRYLTISREEVEKDIEIGDEEARAYFDEHKKDLNALERRQAGHILLKTPPHGDELAVEAVRQKAQELYESISEGGNFTQLAMEHSEDPASAEKGGDLGFFTKGMMLEPFEDAAFSLEEGEVSEPVRTLYGWHIIKVEKIEPGKSFEEVRDSVIAKLKSEKAENFIWERANDVYDEIIQLGSLKSYADHNDITLSVTDLFGQMNPPADLALNPMILAGVFELEQGELSSLLDVASGIMITEVLEKKAPYVPPLDEVRDKARSDFVMEKARAMAREKAERFLAAAREASLADVAQADNVTLKDSGFFKRSDTQKGELPMNVLQEARSLHEKKVYTDGPIPAGNKFYVAAFKERRQADLSKFADQRNDIEDRLLTQKQQTVFEAWKKELREGAEIELTKQL